MSLIKQLYPDMPAELIAPPPFLQEIFDSQDSLEVLYWYRTFRQFLAAMNSGDNVRLETLLADLTARGRGEEARQIREHADRFLEYVLTHRPQPLVTPDRRPIVIVVAEEPE